MCAGKQTIFKIANQCAQPSWPKRKESIATDLTSYTYYAEKIPLGLLQSQQTDYQLPSVS